VSPSDAAVLGLQESPWVVLRVWSGVGVLLSIIGMGLRMLRGSRGRGVF
jgi:hypothetical protein